MNKLLFKKAFRDLLSNKRKAITALSAVIIGMVAFGILLFFYELITNEIVTTHSPISPSSATIRVDRIDHRFIELTKQFSDIAEYEVKSYNQIRGQKSNGLRKICYHDLRHSCPRYCLPTVLQRSRYRNGLDRVDRKIHNYNVPYFADGFKLSARLMMEILEVGEDDYFGVPRD